jgi:hypothetical protein
LLRRRIRGIIYATSFDDKQLSETVCRVNRIDILMLLHEPAAVSLGDIPDVSHGEVLVDSRGQGSFQK